MLEPSIRAGSEGWYQVLESGQKVGIETRLDDQSKDIELSQKERITLAQAR